MKQIKLSADKIGRVFQAIPSYFWFALLIRLVLMALTGHQDAWIIPWTSFPAFQENVYLYDFLAAIRDATKVDSLGTLNWAPNPPLTYYTIAGWMSLLKGARLLDTQGWHYSTFTAKNLIFPIRMLFLTKGLYLMAEMGTWVLLRRLVPFKRRKLLDLVWLFSPVTLIGIYVMGQTDILAIFWVILALVLARKALNPPSPSIWPSSLALFCLGIGAAYKFWPLMLVPLWALILRKDWLGRIGLSLCAALPLLVTILPFLPSPTFQAWVLFGHTDSSFTLGQPEWIQKASPFILAWGAAFIFLVFSKPSFDLLWKASLFVLLSFFTFNAFWEFYWLIWVFPFLTLAVSYIPRGIWAIPILTIHFLLYMIGGWGLGIEVFNIGFRSFPFAELRLQDYLFPPDFPDRVFTILTITFSLFVVSSWGLFAIIWLGDRLPIKTFEDEDKNLKTWPVWLSPGIFIFYVFATFQVGSEPYGRIPFFSILRQILRTMQLDPGFLLLFLSMILLASGLWLIAVGIDLNKVLGQKRRLKLNESELGRLL